MNPIVRIRDALKCSGAEVAYSKNFKGLPLTRDNFSSICKKEYRNVYAVDGGSAVIMDGGPWLIAKIRVAVVGYDASRKNFQSVREYYVFIISRDVYEICLTDESYEPVSVELPDFNAFEIDEVPAKIMKVLEWLECKKLCESGKGLFVLMDSSLEPDNDMEKELIRSVAKTDNIIIGFCKTSRVRTNNGRSLLGVVNGLSPKGKAWFYHPLYAGEDFIRTYIARLNSLSKYCHKVQLFSNCDCAESVFSVLAYFASDSETIGYPYPLVKADKVARINYYEKRRAENFFDRELKKTELKDDVMSQGFHSELDKRMYRK